MPASLNTRAACLAACTLLLGAAAEPARAQASGWRSVDQQASWYGVFADQAIGDRVALWFDGQWRRMGIGAEPQQLLIRPGLLLAVAPGVRVGAGYAWIATSPYGEEPGPTPLREHRIWQQLSLAHRAGGMDVAHRYRFEQRWIAPVIEGQSSEWAFQQRARYLVRAQRSIPGLRLGGAPLLGFAWDEVFLSIGHADAAVRLTQNRIGAGVAIPLDARRRVEVGYMNLWNPLAAAAVNEINHTLTLSLVWTAGR